MATDVERLIVRLEASLTKYEKELRKAPGVADRQARRIEGRFDRMNRRLNRSFSNLSRNIGAGLIASLGVREIQRYADAWVRVQNQLRVVGLEGEALNGTLDSLFAIAQRNGVAIEPLVTLYGRLAQSQRELGANNEELQRFTEGVSLALRVAGTDASQASGALLQLSQAMGGAIVRAEEFNSINEGARPILQAVADGLEDAGGSVAKLRSLVIEGNVSSEAFFRAFLAGMGKLQSQADSATTTAAQGFNRVGNSLTALFGKFAEASGLADRFTGALGDISGALDFLAGRIETIRPLLEYLFRGLPSILRDVARLGEQLGLLESAPPLPVPPSIPANSPGQTSARGPVSLSDFALPGSSDKDAQRFQRQIDLLEQRTAALRLEADVMGLSAFEAEKARVAFDLLAEAKQHNIPIDDALRARIDVLATSYADAVVELERLSRAEEFLRDASADVLKGFVSDLQEGKSATEALSGALDRLADRLLDLATDQIISGLFGGLTTGGAVGGGGGLLAGLFMHKGGKVGSPSVPSKIVPASTFANAPRLHNGLRADEFPAILQRGETVIPRGKNAHGGNISVPINVNLDARGADRDAIERAVARIETEIPQRAVQAVREAQSRRVL